MPEAIYPKIRKDVLSLAINMPSVADIRQWGSRHNVRNGSISRIADITGIDFVNNYRINNKDNNY